VAGFLENILKYEYTFTPYIPELVKPLNRNKGLILANLLTKMAKFYKEGDKNLYYGKEYHFYYSKKDIALKELVIDYSEFNKYMKQLSEYATEFKGREKGKEGYYTTYFFLKLDKIQSLFEEGAKMLGKKLTKVSDGKEQKPRQSKSSKPKDLPENVSKALKTMNETEKKYQRGDISENAYTQTIQEIEGLVMSNKYKLIKNNNVWEIKP